MKMPRWVWKSYNKNNSNNREWDEHNDVKSRSKVQTIHTLRQIKENNMKIMTERNQINEALVRELCTMPDMLMYAFYNCILTLQDWNIALEEFKVWETFFDTCDNVQREINVHTKRWKSLESIVDDYFPWFTWVIEWIRSDRYKKLLEEFYLERIDRQDVNVSHNTWIDDIDSHDRYEPIMQSLYDIFPEIMELNKSYNNKCREVENWNEDDTYMVASLNNFQANELNTIENIMSSYKEIRWFEINAKSLLKIWWVLLLLCILIYFFATSSEESEDTWSDKPNTELDQSSTSQKEKSIERYTYQFSDEIMNSLSMDSNASWDWEVLFKQIEEVLSQMNNLSKDEIEEVKSLLTHYLNTYDTNGDGKPNPEEFDVIENKLQQLMKNYPALKEELEQGLIVLPK